MKPASAKIFSNFIPGKKLRRIARQFLSDGYWALLGEKGGPRIHYWRGEQNFGDLLNEKLAGFFCRQFRYAPPHFADYICIGSLLDTFLASPRTPSTKRPLHVLGAGFICRPISDETPEQFCRPMQFHVLRGRLTRERCAQATGQDLRTVPLGDPALLTPRLFPNIRPKHGKKVGIIPHYADRDNQLLRERIRLTNTPHVFLDVSDPPERFLSELVECGLVLSTAMHPLICADALGIPNRHIVAGSGIVGQDYKFRDYYSAYEAEEYTSIDLRKTFITDASLDELRDTYIDKTEEAAALADRIFNTYERIFPLSDLQPPLIP